MKELNAFKRSREHTKKKGVRGLRNVLPADSKAGVALQWLRLSRTGKAQVANLIKMVQGLNKDDIMQNKVHRSITQNTLEHGKIVLEYYPRNKNGVKSKYILNFLWRATGAAFSAAALHLANEEIERVEENRDRPDGLWVGSLRNSSSIQELKDHRNSFLQVKYNFLKKREKRIKHAEEYSWKNGLRE